MKNRFIEAVIIIGIVLLTASCRTAGRVKLMKITMELNDAETSLNAWGKIAVSDLDLIPNKGQFKVPFNEDVTNYVQAARSNISGGASSVVESGLYLGLSLARNVRAAYFHRILERLNKQSESNKYTKPSPDCRE